MTDATPKIFAFSDALVSAVEANARALQLQQENEQLRKQLVDRENYVLVETVPGSLAMRYKLGPSDPTAAHYACQNCMDNGRRLAVPIKGSEFIEPCDTLLIAIGQRTVNDYLDVKLDLDRWGSVRVGEDGQTSVKGVFAAGDYVTGPTTVIEAVGHGRQIAAGIDTWLMGRQRRRKVVRIEPVEGPLRERAFDFIDRQPMPTSALGARNRELDHEVEKGFGAKRALREAKRCYLCNLKYQIDVDNCIYCRACIEVAPKNCIKLVEGVEINEDGSYGELLETSAWDRVGAIWIDNNECIRCGACFMVCPTKCITITRNEFVVQDM